MDDPEEESKDEFEVALTKILLNYFAALRRRIVAAMRDDGVTG
jgi:hypothetical protein